MQDAPVEQIAKEVGIARGLIYRQFSSKDELYVLTVTDYLAELAASMEDADGLEAVAEAFARFCVRYPAFVDCALSIMQRPGAGPAGARVRVRLAAPRRGDGELHRPAGGRAARARAPPTPDYTANVLWTQGLGLMHLARIRVGVRRVEGGVPELFAVDAEEVVRSCVRTAQALAG